ncbi:MAG TPA: Flp pilus assembly protein CpaB [Terriglobales bacterium]|nr:Flp pilus assembly protein CpaB [Terriglobales bacterium]
MNRNRLVLIGVVALGLAAFVSFSIYRVLRVAMGAQRATPTTTVVVAATDLAVGTRLEEKDLRLAKFPESDLPPGVFHSTAEAVGRGVIVPMTKNELVIISKLAGENAGAGLPALIPSGMRAVSVKVNDVISVAGFVTAGTRVDVILTGNPGEGGNENLTTTTVLSNVQVLAAGQRLQKNEQGEPQQVTVITLLVTPEDAQKLTLASNEGRIQLSLRNPLDTGTDPVPVLKNATLYRMQPGGEPAPRAQRPTRHFAKAAAPVTAPAPYMVEMIRGNDRQISKF